MELIQDRLRGERTLAEARGLVKDGEWKACVELIEPVLKDLYKARSAVTRQVREELDEMLVRVKEQVDKAEKQYKRQAEKASKAMEKKQLMNLHEAGRLLNLDWACKDEEKIAKAFKRESLRHHPDRNLNDPNATERFQQINAAHDAFMAQIGQGSSQAEKKDFVDAFDGLESLWRRKRVPYSYSFHQVADFCAQDEEWVTSKSGDRRQAWALYQPKAEKEQREQERSEAIRVKNEFHDCLRAVVKRPRPEAWGLVSRVLATDPRFLAVPSESREDFFLAWCASSPHVVGGGPSSSTKRSSSEQQRHTEQLFDKKRDAAADKKKKKKKKDRDRSRHRSSRDDADDRRRRDRRSGRRDRSPSSSQSRRSSSSFSRSRSPVDRYRRDRDERSYDRRR